MPNALAIRGPVLNPLWWWPIPALAAAQTFIAVGALVQEIPSQGVTAVAGQASQLGGLGLAIVAVIYLAKKLSEEKALSSAKDALILMKLSEKDAQIEKKDEAFMEMFRAATQALESHNASAKRIASAQDRMAETQLGMNRTLVMMEATLARMETVRQVIKRGEQ